MTTQAASTGVDGAPPSGYRRNSLYVGDLDMNVTDSQLYDLFSQVGSVLSVRVCRDVSTRRSLRYGYVNYVDPRDAARAIEVLYSTPLNGKPIRIMYPYRGPGESKAVCWNINIKNLDKAIDQKAAHVIFSEFGNILSCKIATDSSGQSKGYGFVQYDSEEAAQKAIEKMNGMLLNDKQVYVGPFLRKQKRRYNTVDQTKFTQVYVKKTRSKSTTHLPSWKHDVFLSFRRKDTRKNIIDDLYTSLADRSINIYEDNIAAFYQGKETILDAIERSRFVIIVISKNYLCSSCCMDELANIMEIRNDREGTVIPVLYNIKDTEVFTHTGPFGGRYYDMFKYDDRWKKWHLALKEAGRLAGWSSTSYRDKSVEEIVETISHGLSSIKPNDARNLIGMKPRMQHVIKDLLKIGSGGVRMIGIYGVGGGGKTALAMAVYNEIVCKFGGRCSFVGNLKDDARKHGLKKLQEKVLADVFKANNMTLKSNDDGKRIIKERMARFSVLIVLDDVDHISQLEALVGAHAWFGKGSRIIITTRYKRLLKAHGVDSVHQVDLLKNTEAVELFNRYAVPKETYEKLSLEVVRSAGDLPLALKVLGSFLRDKEEKVWTSTLIDLQLGGTETLEKLKISFNGLKPVEKEMFLDIALFLRNREKTEVLEILDACGYETNNMVDVLINKSLISVSNGHFRMHELLQEMGRNIVLEEHPKYGRIWRAKELVKICSGSKYMKKEAIEATKVKRIQVTFDEDPPIDFSNAFTRMNDLRFLDISISQMSKDRSDDKEPKVLPKTLRWVSWSGYPGKYLPRDFQANELVVMHMTSSKIVHLSEEQKCLSIMPRLKTLDLSGSEDLISIPTFVCFPNIEKLILQNCHNLELIDSTIGNLEKLVLLDMSCCTKLKEFPTMVRMTSLKVLICSGCTELRTFPQFQGKMDSLEHVSLQNSGIQDLPNTIGSICSLVSIDLCNCKSLKSLSLSFFELERLRSLKLNGCPKLQELPVSLGDVRCLEELVLDDTGITELPDFIWNLNNLKVLSFKHGDKAGASRGT